MKCWEVYYAEVFFEDDPEKSKIRPVIVLEKGVFQIQSLKITSQEKNDYRHVELRQWKSAGLTKPSWVDVSKILQLPETAFKEYLGTIDPMDEIEILRRIQSIV